MIVLLILILIILSAWIIRKMNKKEKRDWKEYIPYYKRKIDLAEQEADEILQKKFLFRGDGYCYQLWELQQKILKEKYKINWKSPADLNEHILYD
ncbi:MAG: hypothetical protein ACKOX3_00505 [Bacteroidota bacterium]